MAQKRPSSGTKEPSLAQRLRDDPLFVELGKIGRLRNPLEPARLTQYDRLLASKEVQRRSGTNASRERLATCASEALRAAVDTITAEPDCHVGQAVFGVAAFDGLQIGRRQERLYEEHGITIDEYKTRRPRIVQIVMFYLEREEPDTTLGPPHPRPDNNKRLSPNSGPPEFIPIADLAAELHYAGLACIFAYQGSRGGKVRKKRPRPRNPQACLDAMLDSYARFLIAWQSHLPEFNDRHLRQDIRELLSATTRSIRSASPFTMQDETIVIRYLQHGGIRNPETQRIYNTWVKWCGVAPFENDTEPDRELWKLTTEAGSLARFMSRFGRCDRPIFHNAEKAAYTILARYYDLDDALTYQAEAFFEATSFALTVTFSM